MASFYGCSFVYKDLPSELFDVVIMNFDSGQVDSNSIINAEIDGEYIKRSPIALYYSTNFNTSIEFNMTIGRNTPMTNADIGAITSWLIGSQGYMPFKVVQDDMSDTILYTIFTDAIIHYFGNLPYSMTLHGVCNSPFAFTEPRTLSLQGTAVGSSYLNIKFYNRSINSDYMYPDIKFKINDSGNSFEITNFSDSNEYNRVFSFTDLLSQEEITVDNKNKIITSSFGNSRLGNFSKNWLRLLPGENDISISGEFSELLFTYSFSKVFGA